MMHQSEFRVHNRDSGLSFDFSSHIEGTSISTFRLYGFKVSRIRALYIRPKISTGLAIGCHG